MLADVLATVRKAVIDNSPQILTAIGVVGCVTTAVLTGRAAYETALVVHDERWVATQIESKVTTKQIITGCWQLYIPPVVAGTMTVSAIIASNQIGTRRAAGLAAAYSLSEKAYKEYQARVAEKIGQNSERAIRDDLAADRVRAAGPNREIIISSKQHLCFDEFSARYFESTMEVVRRAEVDLNFQILNDGYASLSDLYDRLGLAHTSFSDEVGWTTDAKLEIKYSTVLTEDGVPCISIGFQTQPVRNYWRFS